MKSWDINQRKGKTIKVSASKINNLIIGKEEITSAMVLELLACGGTIDKRFLAG